MVGTAARHRHLTAARPYCKQACTGRALCYPSCTVQRIMLACGRRLLLVAAEASSLGRRGCFLPAADIWRAAQHRRLTTAARRRAAAPPAAGSDGGSAAAAAAGAYLTVAEPHTAETEVKKSRFIAHAWPCTTAEEALQLIDSERDPAASHNCWAYKIGQQYRSSDDGEPGGTAGRPILAAIEGEGLDGVAVLVVRYFGGTKLGAGGLVRAYGGAAREVLRAAARREVTPRVSLQLEVPFELLGAVYPLLEQHGAARDREDYGEGAAAGVSLLVSVEAARAEGLGVALADATCGRVQARPAAAEAVEEAAG